MVLLELLLSTMALRQVSTDNSLKDLPREEDSQRQPPNQQPAATGGEQPNASLLTSVRSAWFGVSASARRRCQRVAARTEGSLSGSLSGKLANTSWLNRVEIWFGILSRKALRGLSTKSTAELRQAIEAFNKAYAQHAKPFKWRKHEVKGPQLRNTIVNLCN